MKIRRQIRETGEELTVTSKMSKKDFIAMLKHQFYVKSVTELDDKTFIRTETSTFTLEGNE